MSIEAVSPSEPSDIVELFGPEALLARRRALQRELGEVSLRVTSANQEYHDCIVRILETNEAIRKAGIDPNSVANDLQHR